jgi:hypothetical protein
LGSRRNSGEQAGSRRWLLRAQQLAHTIEGLGLGAVHVWLQLVGEASGLTCLRHRLGRGQTASNSVCDRCDRADHQQDREEDAHSPLALGRGGGGRVRVRALVRMPAQLRGPVRVREVSGRSAVGPERIQRLRRGHRLTPAGSASAVGRTAAAAVGDLLEVLIALGCSGWDRDSCAGNRRHQGANREHADDCGRLHSPR